MTRTFKIVLSLIVSISSLFAINCGDYGGEFKSYGSHYYAITGNTAAEIIYKRVGYEKKNMGLTSWKNSPEGPIYKYDVDIAKNYLNEKELRDLNRIVTMYLDYAEDQAERHIPMAMEELEE